MVVKNNMVDPTLILCDPQQKKCCNGVINKWDKERDKLSKKYTWTLGWLCCVYVCAYGGAQEERMETLAISLFCRWLILHAA